MKKVSLVLSLSVLLLSSCSSDDDVVKGDVDISVLASKFNTSNTTFKVEENEIVITSKGVPDHKSAYYPVSNVLYEAYGAAGFVKNPNSISELNMVMTVPRYPAKASSHESTSLGTMGIAVNSVSLFNQYAAPGDDLENEIPTFDQWDGHPQNQGVYHYHLEPSYLTATNGKESLIGILMDGFPVYGTHENGVQITNADLDEYHGHTAPTADFPNGIYHYHITAEDPYINGNGYYGTKGTLSN